MHKLNIFLLAIFIGVSGFAQTDTLKVQSNLTEDDTTDTQSSTVPAFAVDADVLETESSTQDVSGLLQSSRDIYVSIAGFNFGTARYRIRGLGSENYQFMINGVKINDPYTDWAVFRYWAGLNDVTRYPEVTNGVGANAWSFGGLGGTSNTEMRASAIRKTNRISYAISNRSYTHRLMYTYATGLMSNGFAVAFSGSGRYAEEGYRQGTSFSSGSYFLSVEKKLNEKHSLGVVGFGAPTVQGKAGIAIQEIYDLTEDNFYNPYVGYQTNAETGEKELRNSRIRNTHVPHFFLTHYFSPSKNTKLNTTAFVITGKTKNSRLDWYSGKDPRPDYYKYLPSYFDSRNQPNYSDQATNDWHSGTLGYVDFDHLYFVNSKNIATVYDADGTSGNTVEGKRANYIIANDVQQDFQYGAKTTLQHNISDKLIYSGGLSYSNYTGTFYREMKDLLGADWWVDVNKFAERDFADPNAAQINLDEPNRLIEVGEKFGANFELHKTNADFYSQLEFKLSKIDGFIGVNASTTSYWRNGIYKNGIYPDQSQGESEKTNFLNYGVKAGVVYKITGRHFVALNGIYQNRPPSIRNSYLQPAWNALQPGGLKSETVFGGDFSYHARFSKVNLRATIYHYQVKNQLWSRSFYHDALAAFINYSMSGVDHLYQGGELGAEVVLTQTLKAKLAFGMGQYLYNSRPSSYAYSDNINGAVIDETTIYLKNFHVGGTPETVGSFGLEYRSPKYWFVGADFNYFADMYLEPNPDRRTEHALEKYISSDPQWEQIIGQKKLDNGYTINVYAGKSWMLKHKYFINVNINVSNLLNVQDFIVGGFEQLRYDSNDIERFPNKYSYMFGRTYFAMVSFRF